MKRIAKTLIPFSLTAFALMGCGSKVEAPPLPPAAELKGDAVSAKEDGKSASARLMGGYAPEFEHRIRSQRHELLANGEFLHIVIVEYSVSDDVIGPELAAELKARGLTVVGPSERSGALRYVAQNSKVGRMTADISMDSPLSLGPGSNGTIYFAWHDAQQR